MVQRYRIKETMWVCLENKKVTDGVELMLWEWVTRRGVNQRKNSN